MTAVGEECIIFCPVKILPKKARVRVSYATRSDVEFKTTKNLYSKNDINLKRPTKLRNILDKVSADHPFLFMAVNLGSYISVQKRFQMT